MTKICSKCKKELSIESFNVRKVKNEYKAFSYCKECERNYNNNRYKHICENCGKEYKSGRKQSKFCQECNYKMVGKRGSQHLIKWNKKPENNPFYGVHRFGKDNPNYDPYKTDEERENQRIIFGYEEWRKQVFERDNFTCKKCGDKKGGNLNAHHLNSYSDCKEQRTDVNNGITLCEKCHKQFHNKYGYGHNTKEQYNEFLMAC